MTAALRSGAEVARDWVRALQATQRLQAEPGNTLAAVVNGMALSHPDAMALEGEDEGLTYAALAARMNQVSRWAIAQGLAAGETVALLMPNRPDYVALWLGLSQAGCVTALLNTNLAGDALAHCVRSAGARTVIVADGLRWDGPGAVLRSTIDLAAFDGGPGAARPAPNGRALLIYTSGTTGLPKAANVSNARVLDWSGWFAGMMDAQPDDRLYNCLPLYHSTGGVVAVGAMLVSGGCVVIRERFSASRFWADVAASRCTVFQYIGELCRYLLAADPAPAGHRLRLCCGNGLSAEVWTRFKERFGIPRILEFYAATEGSVSLYNCEGKPGAIGRIPAFLAHRFPLALVRCDPDTSEPVRDADGRCLSSDIDEPGEALAPIGGARQFEGYTDPAASERKLLRGVFAEDDCWFRTGDLMRRDAAGFYSFVDRLGDTFRWKGENVATAEVAAAVMACPGVVDAVVYGVAVPGAEGKAGMAAIVPGPAWDPNQLRDHLQTALPPYARPVFLRICHTLDRTGTFKLAKAALVRQGLESGDDTAWFDDKATGRYIPLDPALRRQIQTGEARL